MPKTIFNTTEKSNFILNMTIGEYQGFLVKILLGWMLEERGEDGSQKTDAPGDARRERPAPRIFERALP